MRFVGNDEIEKAHVKCLEDLQHCRVGGKVDALCSIFCRAGAYNGEWLVDEVRKGILCLFAEFPTVAKKEHPLYPAGANRSVRAMATRVFPVPVAWTKRVLRWPLLNRSPTRLIASS